MKACIADWDGTLRPGFIARDWLFYLINHAGIAIHHYSEFDFLLKKYEQRQISYEQFSEQATINYGKALSGLSCSAVEDAAQKFVVEDHGQLFPFVLPLFKLLKERGFRTIVLSGGPIQPIQAYSTALRLDEIFAVDVQRCPDQTFSDRVILNYGLRSNKQKVIEYLLEEGVEIVMSLGDSDADKPLLDAALHPFLISRDAPQRCQEGYSVVAPEDVFDVVNKLQL